MYLKSIARCLTIVFLCCKFRIWTAFSYVTSFSKQNNQFSHYILSPPVICCLPLTRTFSGFIWRLERESTVIRSSQNSKPFHRQDLFSRVVLIIFLHVKNAKERERIDKNQTEFKAFSQAREIVSQVHFTRCPHTRECMQRYTNISLLAKTENSSHNWE